VDRPDQSAKNLCLRWLALRNHSRQELHAKLTRKGYSSDSADCVIADLAAQDYQSDEKFAESYARMLINKGYGPFRIKEELKLKGISFKLTPEIMPDIDSLADKNAGGWLALLERQYVKKYSQDTPLSLTEWAKRVRFLQQRGFSLDMIMQLKDKLAIRSANL
jgi:regulatory protein